MVFEAVLPVYPRCVPMLYRGLQCVVWEEWLQEDGLMHGLGWEFTCPKHCISSMKALVDS